MTPNARDLYLAAHRAQAERLAGVRPAVGARKSAGERVALALAAALFGVVVAFALVRVADVVGAW